MELTEMTMFTEDVDSMASFHRRLFGSDPVTRHDGIAIFDVGGVEILIHEQPEPSSDGPPDEDHFSFAVEDVDVSFGRLREQGLDVIHEPADYDWGRSAYLRDPDGRLVELARR
jgi:catechol 2,3-dioxygenase-like lactoylglutathione lyase family enzyme